MPKGATPPPIALFFWLNEIGAGRFGLRSANLVDFRSTAAGGPLAAHQLRQLKGRFAEPIKVLVCIGKGKAD